jgi:hypothetical protein
MNSRQKQKGIGGGWTQDDERGDGLVHPAVCLEEVADNDADEAPRIAPPPRWLVRRRVTERHRRRSTVHAPRVPLPPTRGRSPLPPPHGRRRSLPTHAENRGRMPPGRAPHLAAAHLTGLAASPPCDASAAASLCLAAVRAASPRPSFAVPRCDPVVAVWLSSAEGTATADSHGGGGSLVLGG